MLSVSSPLCVLRPSSVRASLLLVLLVVLAWAPTPTTAVTCPVGYWGVNCLSPCPGRVGSNTFCNGRGDCNSTSTAPPSTLCTCFDGFAGDVCQYSRWSECNGHGTPTGPTTCACDSQYTGARCDSCAASYFAYPACRYCNVTLCGGGTCLADGTCGCSSATQNPADCGSCADTSNYFAFPNCTFCDRLTTCSGNGDCNPATGGCLCDAAFAGPSCSFCRAGYFGSACTPCPGGAVTPCNGRGPCDQGIFGSGNCACSAGYSGVACEFSSTATCATRGAPLFDGGCACGSSFAGSNCAACATDYVGTTCALCNPATTCSGHGNCSEITGACVCDARFTGAACEQCASGRFAYPDCRICVSSSDCSSHGTCDTATGFCNCAVGFTGVICNACESGRGGSSCTLCPGTAGNPCNGRGTCSTGIGGTGACACTSPYSGVDCNDPVITAVAPFPGVTTGTQKIVVTGQLLKIAVSAPTSIGVNTVPNANCNSGDIADASTFQCTLPALQPGPLPTNALTLTSGGRSTAAFTYEFAPPRLESFSVNALILTVTGTNFGTLGVFLWNGAPTPTSGYGQTQFTVNLPLATTLASVPFTLVVNGDSSNTLTYDYEQPEVTSISAPTAPAAGGVALTLYGNFLGGTPSVTIGGRAATGVTMFNGGREIRCSTPSGIGQQVGAVTIGVLSGTFLYNYDAPRITSVSGCTNFGFTTRDCVATGSLTVTGANFGFQTAAFGACTALTVSLLHGITGTAVGCPITGGSPPDSQIICTLPSGMTGQNMSVAVQRMCAPAGSPLIVSAQADQMVSYANVPQLGALSVVSGAATLVQVSGFAVARITSTVSVAQLRVTRSAASSVSLINCNSVWIGPAGNPLKFVATSVTPSLTEVTFTLPANLGAAGTRLFVTVRDSSTLFYSDQSLDYVEYPAPSLVASSLRFWDDATGTLSGAQPLVSQLSTGEAVYFQGANFGTRAEDATMTYGPYACQIASLADTTLTCTTAAAGSQLGPFSFTLCVGGAIGSGSERCSSASSDTYRYPNTVPIITGVGGSTSVPLSCVNFGGASGGFTFDCIPFVGGVTDGLIVYGSFPVSANDVYSANLLGQTTSSCGRNGGNSLTQLNCRMPFAYGFNLTLTVSVGNLVSLPYTGVSFRPPVISQLSGGSGACDSYNQALQTLPSCNAGGFISVFGSRYGPNAQLLMNGVPVPTTGTATDSAMSFVFSPANNTRWLQLPLQVRTETGVLSNRVFISLRQAGPGWYQNASYPVVQRPCPAGSYTPTSGMTGCLSCAPGQWAPSGVTGCGGCVNVGQAFYSNDTTGYAACKACPPGFAANPTYSGCVACPLGQYLSGTSCLPAGVSYYVDTYGRLSPSACPVGSYTPGTGYSACLSCEPGKYGGGPPSASCTDAPPGTYSEFGASTSACNPGSVSQGGATSCTRCDPGRFMGFTGRSACDSCGAGTYSGSGVTVCTECNVGSYTSGDGSTLCTLCLPGYAQPNNRSQSCDPCTAGRYTSAQGRSQCSVCDDGKFQAFSARTVCDLCGAGKFNDGTTGTRSQCADCAPGKFSNQGQVRCGGCVAGKYSSSGATGCTNCESGKFSGTSNSSACTPCGVGLIAVPGSSGCVGCATGSIPAPGASSCAQCAAGSFQETASDCTPCPAGNFSASPGSRSCVPCAKGSFSSAPGSTICYQCSPGTYTIQEGLSLCAQCPAGKMSELSAGSKNCTLCPKGKFSGDGSLVCSFCPVGKYAPSAGMADCWECNTGTYADKTGLEQCTKCPLGTFNEAVRQTACKKCFAGRYANVTGSDTCDDCLPGSVAVVSGSTVCTACAAGTYSSIAGQAQCVDCESGSFNLYSGMSKCLNCLNGTSQPASGQSGCVSCEKGKYTDGTDQRNLACFRCGPATFVNTTGATGCMSCPAGRFANGLGFQACSPCPVGSYVGEPGGASACVLCEPGKFTNSNGSFACGLCPYGTVASGSGLQRCELCGSGSVAEGTGLSQCTECDPGRSVGYNTTTSAFTCVDCEASTYARNAGSPNCTSCEAGKYSSARTATTCLECEPGRFGNITGLTVCFDCPIGKYSTFSGQSVCAACDPGSFTQETGRSICTQCNVGNFQDLMGQDFCKTCQPGKYARTRGQSNCTDCEAGKFQQSPQQSDCVQCPVGSETKLTGQSNCTACEDGYFRSAETQSFFCVPCERGTRWQSASQVCLACTPGRFAANTGQRACDQCERGWVAPGEAASACTPCPAGHTTTDFLSCSACAQKTIAPFEGWKECTQCSPTVQASTPASAPTKCLCPAGTYMTELSNVDTNVVAPCAGCPEGGVCEFGTTYDTVYTKNGYWRAKNTTLHFYQCIIPEHCLGGANQGQCANNREGPICALCVPGTRASTYVSSCDACPNLGGLVTAVLIALTVAAILLMYYVLLRTDRDLIELVEKRDKKSVEWDLYDLPELGDGEGVEAVVTDDKRDFVPGDERQKPNITYKMKIILGFLQIASNLVLVVDIPWPSYYRSFIQVFQVVNLNFVPWQSVGCVAGLDYYGKFLIVTITPPIVFALLTLFFVVPLYIKGWRDHRRALRGGAAPDHGDQLEFSLARKRTRRKFWKLVLFTCFLFYPYVAQVVLSLFVCRQIDGIDYLVADFTVHCFDDRYNSFRGYAIFTIFLYPVGVPAFFFSMLWRYRERLVTPDVKLQLGFLYAGYHRKMWYFELIDMAHKLFLTSILKFFTPFTVQLSVGLGVTGLYFIFVFIFRPYLRKGDDRLQLFAETEIYLLLLAAYIIEINHRNGLDYATDVALSFLLTFITVACIVLFLLMALQNTRKIYHNLKKQKTNADLKLRLEKAASEIDLANGPAHLLDDKGEPISPSHHSTTGGGAGASSGTALTGANAGALAHHANSGAGAGASSSSSAASTPQRSPSLSPKHVSHNSTSHSASSVGGAGRGAPDTPGSPPSPSSPTRVPSSKQKTVAQTLVAFTNPLYKGTSMGLFDGPSAMPRTPSTKTLMLEGAVRSDKEDDIFRKRPSTQPGGKGMDEGEPRPSQSQLFGSEGERNSASQGGSASGPGLVSPKRPPNFSIKDYGFADDDVHTNH